MKFLLNFWLTVATGAQLEYSLQQTRAPASLHICSLCSPHPSEIKDTTMSWFTAQQELKLEVTRLESGSLVLAQAPWVATGLDIKQVLNSRQFYKFLLTGKCLESNENLTEKFLWNVRGKHLLFENLIGGKHDSENFLFGTFFPCWEMLCWDSHSCLLQCCWLKVLPARTVESETARGSGRTWTSREEVEWGSSALHSFPRNTRPHNLAPFCL